jgi:uncharacterized membrane protein
MPSPGCSTSSRGRLFALASGALLLLYPLVVYFSIRYVGVGAAAAATVLVVGLRLAARRTGALQPSRAHLAFTTAAGVALALVSLLQRRADAMLYYPVLVNASLLAAFAWSLSHPPTAIERIARLTEGPLSPAAIVYTRKVTVAWAVFFACNGAIAFATARWTSIETWTLYNGALAYVLIGVMFGAEWLVRRHVRKMETK